ncbi:MAG: enoyl-CoA hydratase/isomerase family protein [Chloroflexi bacterium]|nr:enoyl-CoA hydratase/isomerase family protein [Chloroflexota bacterium]
MPYETVIAETRDGVAHIMLNRPQAMNSFNPTLIREVGAAIDAAAVDSGVHAIVFRGNGRAFSAGGDLKYIEEKGLFKDVAGHLMFLDTVKALFAKIEAAPVPTIAVVTGFALAGGLEFILSCDLAIASDDAQIGDQHSQHGILPGGGSTVRLPRRIGQQRALELIYTGRRLSGKEAAEYGIVLKSVPRDQVEAEVEKLLTLLRQRSRPLLAAIKSAVAVSIESPRDIALEREQLIVTKFNAANTESAEGAKAFTQGKRS